MADKYPVSEFIKYILSKVSLRTVYMWGTFGNRVTHALIRAKQDQYPNRYDAARIKVLTSFVGRDTYACDCCGLAKWFFMTDGGKLEEPKYRSKYDLSASGFLDKSSKKGKINTMPEKQGLGLWKSGHMGIYIGGGKCVECTLGSRGDGVVISPVSAVGFTHWFEFNDIDYNTAVTAPKESEKPKEAAWITEIKKVIAKMKFIPVTWE